MAPTPLLGGGGGGGGAGYFLGDFARPRLRSFSISSSSDEDKHRGDDLLGDDDTPEELTELPTTPERTAKVLCSSLVYFRAFLVACATR